MRKTVSVSFEGNNVKIVHASLKGTTLSVDKTEIIPDDEFDYYLQKEKSSEFIVTCEFRETFHDVLTVPVLKTRYLEKVIMNANFAYANTVGSSTAYTSIQSAYNAAVSV